MQHFLWYTDLVKGSSYKPSIPGVFQIGKKEKVELSPEVKYDCPRADFHETRACLTFYKEYLYQISWKSDKQFSRLS